MDGVDLIICVAIWTLYKRRGPLTCDDLRASPIASQNRLRSRPNIFRFFADFGAPALPKWSQNRAQNQIFGYLFAILFSTTLLDRFFIDFSRARPLKSSILLRKNNDFHYIDVFAKVQKKVRFWLHFERSKPWKIDKNACLKIIIFLTSFLELFFVICSDFGSISGGHGGSKNKKKWWNIDLGRAWDALWTRSASNYRILNDFWSILIDLGSISGTFLHFGPRPRSFCVPKSKANTKQNAFCLAFLMFFDVWSIKGWMTYFDD